MRLSGKTAVHDDFIRQKRFWPGWMKSSGREGRRPGGIILSGGQDFGRRGGSVRQTEFSTAEQAQPEEKGIRDEIRMRTNS